MKFYLIRHGSTEYNGKGLMLGSTDADLIDNKDPNILRWKEYLSSISIQSIIHSGMKRTYSTAQLINNAIGKNIAIDEDLRIQELNFGDWELKSYDWLYKNQQELFSNWLEDPYNLSPPNGETLLELKERLTSFFDECEKEYEKEKSDDSVIVVTHGGPIRLLWSLIDNINFYEKKVLPASLYCLDWSNKTITEIN